MHVQATASKPAAQNTPATESTRRLTTHPSTRSAKSFRPPVAAGAAARRHTPTASSSTPSNPPASTAVQAAPAAAPRAGTSPSSPPPSAAEQAGFRACKRCQPGRATARPDPQAAAHRRRQRVPRRTCHRTHPPRRPRRATGVGRLTLLRGFRRVLGVSPGRVRPRPASRTLQGCAAPGHSGSLNKPSAPPRFPKPSPSASPTPSTRQASAPPAASTSPAATPWE